MIYPVSPSSPNSDLIALRNADTALSDGLGHASIGANHLQLDLNDLDEKLVKLKKRLKTKLSEEEREDNKRILAETEARIASKKLEMAEIHAVMNMADGDEDSNSSSH